MALHDGFFDAAQNDETGEYDRSYEAGDFTGYFGKIIGSGVCVHDNPDSFLVRMDSGQAIVSPGYLFIKGYWLKNDADYSVSLPGTGTYAIVAKLNTGLRMITLEAVSVAQSYPDSLVLAIVNTAAGTADDTRYNIDLCGVIDTAGELSSKVEWAINYIDNEIEAKLAEVEREIAAQEAKLNAKINEVQAVVDRISPPPVGSIKFSASQNVGEEWLPCDGRFVNERDYPELVEALGKLTPSDDKFQLISSGEIGPQISNGVVYDGRMWVYSYSTKKLYGVDLDGGETKTVDLTSDDRGFSSLNIPSTTQPIALSIVKSPVDGIVRLFLAQLHKNDIWIYGGTFHDGASSIKLEKPFSDTAISGNPSKCVPYVISENVSGVETFSVVYDALSDGYSIRELQWTVSGETATKTSKDNVSYLSLYLTNGQRTAFNPKSKGESVVVQASSYQGSYGGATHYTYVRSNNAGSFSRGDGGNSSNVKEILGTPVPLNIVGEGKMLFEPSNSAALVISLKDLDAPRQVNFGLSLPSAARIFVDGGAYLWGKDIYMIFVGTGIIFSRTLEDGSFGYLDTTSVLGTITQFGYLGYSQDEGTLYLLGQDTTNTVKAAKIVLNDLYDYANDGAWLPMIAADGVPAYIKAREIE